jgi:hypothetical protein
MTRAAKPWSAILVLILLFVPGCGDEESPTEPASVDESIELIRIDFNIERFECIVDGDGIEGAGDFAFRVTVDYHEKTWLRQLSDGQSSTLNWSEAMQYANDGNPIEVRVTFICSERDTNILGELFNDADMDGRTATAVESVGVDTSISNYITLGNSNCKVRLHYTLKGSLVVLE